MPPSASSLSPQRLPAPLFCCLFVSQAGIVVLAPMLEDVARDLGVSTPTGGQLRAVSGPPGGRAPLVPGCALRGARLRTLIQSGLSLVAAGSALSAVAPGFA